MEANILDILKRYYKACILCEVFLTQHRPESLWSILLEIIILIDLGVPRVAVWNVLPVVILPRINRELIKFLSDQIESCREIH